MPKCVSAPHAARATEIEAFHQPRPALPASVLSDGSAISYRILGSYKTSYPNAVLVRFLKFGQETTKSHRHFPGPQHTHSACKSQVRSKADSITRMKRMCGIFGYVGERDAKSVLIHGLRRLEYRGYDSAGVAVLSPKGLHVRKCAGRLANLVQYRETNPLFGGTGIGHTRWATHGPATDVNAHPHLSSDGRVAVVHNGVIENHMELRTHLEARGIPFRSARIVG